MSKSATLVGSVSTPSWKRVARGGRGSRRGSSRRRCRRSRCGARAYAGGLRAFDGRCPHRGALLGEGELHDGEIVCRNHRWRFDAETGRRDGGPERLIHCPVREEGDEILVMFRGRCSRAAFPRRPQGGVIRICRAPPSCRSSAPRTSSRSIRCTCSSRLGAANSARLIRSRSDREGSSSSGTCST